MRAIIKKDPFCQLYLGKAIAYRIASAYFTPDQSGYSLFRGLMRDNAKMVSGFARIMKGGV